ncbi:Rieske (2Fe-2S) protein [Streptomyces nogalater]
MRRRRRRRLHGPAAAHGTGVAALPAAEGGAGETSPAAREAAPAGEPLALAGDIPVGGGKVFADRKIVVTQPEKGRFKAFSAVCTHQGCTVSQVSDGTILCPCHTSRFHIADGSVAAARRAGRWPRSRSRCGEIPST